jgi:hypothetical protein
MRGIFYRGILFIFFLSILGNIHQNCKAQRPPLEQEPDVQIDALYDLIRELDAQLAALWDLVEKSREDAALESEVIARYNQFLQKALSINYTGFLPKKAEAEALADIDRIWLLDVAQEAGFGRFSDAPGRSIHYLGYIVEKVQQEYGRDKLSTLVDYNIAREQFGMPPALSYHDIDVELLRKLASKVVFEVEAKGHPLYLKSFSFSGLLTENAKARICIDTESLPSEHRPELG